MTATVIVNSPLGYNVPSARAQFEYLHQTQVAPQQVARWDVVQPPGDYPRFHQLYQLHSILGWYDGFDIAACIGRIFLVLEAVVA